MRRRWKGMLAGVLVVLAAAVVWWLSRPSELSLLQADLDATDPGWRFADIWAARRADQPPSEENVILTLRAADRLLPPAFADWAKAEEHERNNRPLARPTLDPAGVAAWREAAEAMVVARRAADQPFGVAPEPVPDDPYQHPFRDDIRAANRLLHALEADAVFAAAHGDPATGLGSVRAMLAIANGVARNPLLADHGNEGAYQAWATSALWRVLAVSTPADADLATVERELQEAADPAGFVSSLRDWRAADDLFLSAVAAGRVNLWAAGVGRRIPATNNAVGRLYYQTAQVAVDHVALLTYLTTLIQIAERPPWEWDAALATVPAPPDDGRHPHTRRVAEIAARRFQAARQHRAVLTAAVAGVQAERYRLAHGDWPTTTERLNPFSGQPLLVRRQADGLSIYSIGPNGRDNGGRLPAAATLTLGIRLWDVADRRPPEAP